MYAEHHRRRGFGDVRPMPRGDVDRSVGTAQNPDGTEGTLMLAAAIPDERAARDPAGACIADEHQELGNARFAQTVSAVAALLANAGLRRGGVLAIMLPNRVELITSMFAAWRLGAAVTPVNPALTGQEARYQIDDAGAHVVVADGASAAKLEGGGYRIVPVEDVTSPARSPEPEPEPVPVQAG